jgi:hypothetical protein
MMNDEGKTGSAEKTGKSGRAEERKSRSSSVAKMIMDRPIGVLQIAMTFSS